MATVTIDYSSTHPVARPSAAYLAAEKKRKILRTMRAGQEAMWDAGIDYLPLLQGEDVSSPWGYQARLRRTTLYPFVADAVGFAAAQVFQKEIKVKDADERLGSEDVDSGARSGWLEDIDRRGNDLHNFSLLTFEDYWWEGAGLTLVDFPPEGQASAINLTRGEERAEGRRPFWTRYRPEQAIAWRYEVRPTGEKVLAHIRLRECEEKASDDFGSVKEERIRCFWSADSTTPTASFSVWTKTEKGGVETWIETTTRTPLRNQTTIPLDVLGDLDEDPPLLDLAYLNLAHYQMISDLRHIEHTANVPVPYIIGVTKADMAQGGSLSIGPNGLWIIPNPNAKTGFLEHAGQAIGELKKSLDDIKSEARRRTMSSLFDGKPGDVTATSDVLNAGRTLSALQVSAIKLRDFLEQLLVITGRWVGIAPEKCGSVEVNQKFVGLPANSDALDFVKWAVQQGILSKESAFGEGQRQAWIGESLSFEAEQEKIQEDGPSLGIMSSDAALQKRAQELMADGLSPAEAMAQAKAEQGAMDAAMGSEPELVA